MDLNQQTQVSIGRLAEDLAGIEVEKISIPKFGIPNWPKDVTVEFKLGKVAYTVPLCGDDGLLYLKTGTHRIFCRVNRNGSLYFHFSGFGKPAFGYQGTYDGGYTVREVSSHDEQPHYRVAALMLFEQFRSVIGFRAIAHLKAAVPQHNEIVHAAAKAFEPFVPFIVADQLSG